MADLSVGGGCPQQDYKANFQSDLKNGVLKWNDDNETAIFNASLYEEMNRIPFNKDDVGCRYGVDPDKIQLNKPYEQKIQGKLYNMSIYDMKANSD